MTYKFKIGQELKFNHEGNSYLTMNNDLHDISVIVVARYNSRDVLYYDVEPVDKKLKNKYGTINRTFREECFDASVI